MRLLWVLLILVLLAGTALAAILYPNPVTNLQQTHNLTSISWSWT